MATVARDSFYIYGRRSWDDGMNLEACATSRIESTDDGGMVIEMSDDDGVLAIFVLENTDADLIRSINETIFTGIAVMDGAVR